MEFYSVYQSKIMLRRIFILDILKDKKNYHVWKFVIVDNISFLDSIHILLKLTTIHLKNLHWWEAMSIEMLLQLVVPSKMEFLWEKNAGQGRDYDHTQGIKCSHKHWPRGFNNHALHVKLDCWCYYSLHHHNHKLSKHNEGLRAKNVTWVGPLSPKNGYWPSMHKLQA